MAEIRIDYPLVISKAKKIKELSEDIGRISNNLTLLREDTEGYWRGEAASSYRIKCEDLETYLRKLDSKMDNLAAAIIRIADLIKAADEANSQAASNISTGI